MEELTEELNYTFKKCYKSDFTLFLKSLRTEEMYINWSSTIGIVKWLGYFIAYFIEGCSITQSSNVIYFVLTAWGWPIVVKDFRCV